MTAVKSALVIGCGIAGPTAAMALQKAGIDASVYEAYPPEANTARVGGGFNIATNGLDALAAIDALEVARDGAPADQYAMYNSPGKRLGTVVTGLPRADGLTTMTFRRAGLFQALVDEASRRGVPLHFGKRLVGIEQSSASVTATFEDGSQASADVLIGADGIRSKVRKLIDPAAPEPSYTGLVSFGGFAPNPGLALNPRTWRMTFGKRAFWGDCIIDRNEVCWFVNMPSETPLARDQLLAEGMDKIADRLIELFEGDRDVPARAVIRAQGDGIVVVGAQYDLPSVPRWSSGRVVIIGDAAHAVSTSSGQGANQSLESAVTLAMCLRDCEGPEAAFKTFEGLRRPRVERVWADGRKGAASKAAAPMEAFMRDTFMGIGLKYFYNPESSAWLYRHHIEWDVSVNVAAS
jgi:2-polyprenyl-6-methoxyphenol hydroxylase-like FAD-dependent oxidoreductase